MDTKVILFIAYLLNMIHLYIDLFCFIFIDSWFGQKLFQVSHTSMIGDKFVVDINKLECSCRKWTITTIPCYHALTIVKNLNLNGEDCLPHWFLKSTYEETYLSMIYHVNEPHQWKMTSYCDVLPPTKRVLLGRQKKKRRLES